MPACRAVAAVCFPGRESSGAAFAFVRCWRRVPEAAELRAACGADEAGQELPSPDFSAQVVPF